MEEGDSNVLGELVLARKNHIIIFLKGQYHYEVFKSI